MARVRRIAAEHGIIPSRAGVYSVPIAFLDACPAQAWNPGRLPPIRQAHDEGRAAELPPIRVVFYEDGSLRLDDWNHRLTVARERDRGHDRIRVPYLRGGKCPAGEPFVIPPLPEGQERPTTWGPHYQLGACQHGPMDLVQNLRAQRAARATQPAPMASLVERLRTQRRRRATKGGPRRCAGVAGIPCDRVVERGHDQCADCRLMARLSRETGRPVTTCAACGGRILALPGHVDCLTCQEVAVFGADLINDPLADLGPERDEITERLLGEVRAGTTTREQAIAELRAFDARRVPLTSLRGEFWKRVFHKGQGDRARHDIISAAFTAHDAMAARLDAEVRAGTTTREVAVDAVRAHDARLEAEVDAGLGAIDRLIAHT